jgi:hypothetical protein
MGSLGAHSAPPVTIRPISEFVEAQGTTSVFIPPVADYIAWTAPADGLALSFDYAGLANQWVEAESGGAVSLGTTTSGSVVERPLPDGRAEVSVLLHTRNAMTFGISADDQGNYDFANAPTIFGRRAPDALATGDVSLGECFLQITYISPEPGAPLLDLVDAFILGNAPEGTDLVYISFRGSADGTLRDAFGVPDGTPGRAECIQTGLFMSGFHGHVSDGFPAEIVRIHETGG